MPQTLEWNWDDLRYLLAAVRAGSCAAAARELGVAVSTVTRRLAALQKAMGRPLVILNPDGLVLTDDGVRLMEDALQIERSMASLHRRLDTEDAFAGAVRLSAVGTIASEFLAAAAAEFCQRYPLIELTLVGETQMVDVLRGEADIIIRLSRPRQDRLVCRQLATIPMGVYASAEYLARMGRPADAAVSLSGHHLVGLVREFDVLPMSRWLAARQDGARMVLRCSQTVMMARAIRAGAGIGVLPRVMGDGLELLASPSDLPVEGVWVGFHEDVKHVPRIRAVVDWVSETLNRALVG